MSAAVRVEAANIRETKKKVVVGGRGCMYRFLRERAMHTCTGKREVGRWVQKTQDTVSNARIAKYSRPFTAC